MSTAFGFQMLAVVIGWQMYALTKSTMFLGLVGLAQFLPMLLFTLVSGHLADKYNRKFIIFISQIIEASAVLFLALGSYEHWLNKEMILILSFIFGAANSFQGPSMQSLLPNVVSKEIFPKAVALSSSAFEIAVIIGPSLGGILYAFGSYAVYFIIGCLFLLSATLIHFVSVAKRPVVEKKRARSMKDLFAGIAYIKSRPAILGAISLDLFAVLLGGATALLPVYASTILKIGPVGLGVLRSAPSVGALVVSVFLARRPLRKHVGHKMFAAVICFGMATIVFALSKSFGLSMVALFFLGASDIVSVVIRSTFIQIQTPDELRGRVSSVNQLFIGTSNQLGEFESGLTASLFGTENAVLIGGIGTIVIALIWMKLFPSLLRIDNLDHDS